MVKELELPKWFQGQTYPCGNEVTNPFSGESCVLNNLELSMYDFIMGCNYLMERGKGSSKMVGEFHKGLTWFRKANPIAYMTLLD